MQKGTPASMGNGEDTKDLLEEEDNGEKGRAF